MDIRDFKFHGCNGSENVTLKVNLHSFAKWAMSCDSHAKIINYKWQRRAQRSVACAK